jgi:hypothetical protein
LTLRQPVKHHLRVRCCRRLTMSQLLGQTLNTVIESYLHTPRPLRESEIVREILAVFPEQDRTMLVEDLRQRVLLRRRRLTENA